MSGIFDQQIKLAQQQIARYGEAVAWLSPGQPTVPDASQPWITQPSAPSSHIVPLLFTSGKSAPFLQLLAGSDVEAGDAQGLLPAVAFTPTASDTIVRTDGTKLAIKSISPLSPNGQILLWYVVFKR